MAHQQRKNRLNSSKARNAQLRVESLEDRRMLSVTPPVNIITQTVAIVSSPAISNQNTANVNATSATLGATVDSDHGSDITERGFLYAVTADDNNPQLGDATAMQAIVSGTTGDFTADVAGLLPGVSYSFVGYATNSSGTTYTSVGTLNTLDAPSISSPTSSNLTATAVTLGGDVTSDGGDPITERGIVYALTSDNPDPQLGDANVTKATASGTTGVFTVDISGLAKGQTYSFAAYATNSTGTIFSPAATITTFDAPMISSPAVTNLKATSATIGGTVIDDGGDLITARGAVYSLTSENANPQIGDSDVMQFTAGGTTGLFVIDLTGLARGTTYSYAMFVTNSSGTTYTTVSTLTTLDLPSVSSPTVSGLKSTSVTLGGDVTADGADPITQRGVIYALTGAETDLVLGNEFATAATADGTTGDFTVDLTGLTRGTSYSFVAFATNSSGTTYTAASDFTTLDIPTLAATTVSSLKSTSVTLGGDVTADGADPITQRGIVYSLTSDNADPMLGDADAIAVAADGTTGVFSVDLTGLTRGTSYTFVAYATNSSGTTYTAASTLTTLDVPTITSPTADEVTSTSVTLGANVTSDGNDPITARGVAYSLTSMNGNPQLGDGNSTEVDTDGTTGTFAIAITDLPPGMSYSYATFATNSTGTTYTSVGNFATLPTAPVVDAASAHFVTATAATFAAAVSADGGRTISARGFVYSSVYDNAIPQLGGEGVTDVASMGAIGQFAVEVKGLQAGIVYAFAAYATNSEGTTYSDVQLLKPSFQPVTAVAVGDTPKSVAVGDFNGDGQVDIVTVNSRSANLSVKLGNGSGGFGAATNYAAGRTPDFVTVADVNGDTWLDLLVTNGDSRGTVSVLLGNGDGTFQAVTNYAVGNNPVSVTVGDFNGDGRADLAVANQFSNTVSVLLANTLGGFKAAVSYTVGAQPDAIVIGDFNGDHILDLATANRGSGDVSILAGRGNGDFYRAQNFHVGVSPSGLVAADFNSDGLMDLAVADQATNTVNVLLSGNFKPVKLAIVGGPNPLAFQKPMSFGTAAQPVSIVVGDFNSDGNLDLATADQLANAVSVLLGNGDGSFGAATNVNVGNKPQSLAVGDFNGDHRDDLVIANAFSNTVSLLLQPSAPTIGAPTATDVTPDSATLHANVTSDGSDTITQRGFQYQLLSIDGHSQKSPVVTVWADGSIGAFSVDIERLVPGGTYQYWAFATNSLGINESVAAEFTTPAVVPTVVHASGHYVTSTEAMFAGWVANDGGAGISERGVIYSLTYNNAEPQLDGAGVVKVVADGATGRFTLDVKDLLPGATYSFVMYATNRVGTTYTKVQLLSPVFQPATSVDTGDTPSVVAVADFNGDHNADFVTINSRTGDLGLQLADGQGGFGMPVSIAAGLSPTAVAVGDVNGDGFKDLVVTSSDGLVSVLISNHDGTFEEAMQFEVDVQPSSVALGDFNSDGYLDIAVANEFSSSVSVLLGDGAGGFGVATNFSVGRLPMGIVAADFNGDSILDLVTVNQASNDVSVLLGDGAGGFSRAHNFKVGDVPTAIAVGDFNGDGRLDIATANQGSDDVSILLNEGRRGFGRAVSYDVGSQPVSITTGDFNDDGITDLATANQGSDDVSILLGRSRGRFQAADNISVGSNPQFVATGDINGDGLPDLVVANSYSNSVTILLHPGTPTISSPTQTDVTPFSFTLGGDVTGDGAALITERGVLYSVSDVNGNPQLDGLGVIKIATDTNNTGVFTVDVSELAPGVTYTFVAFATNRFGTTYTTPVAIVTTPPDLPSVDDGDVGDITKDSATVSGSVTNDGGGKITDEGAVYSLTSDNDNPQIGGDGVMQVGVDELGDNFSLDLSALRPGSMYSVAIYAQNGAGITYSKVFEFTTAPQPNPVVDAVTDSLAATADTVIITGTDFNPDASDISVLFNDGAVGEVTDATATSLTVTFSTRPASAGPLTAIVTSNGLSSGDAVQVATITPVVTKATSNLAADATTLMIDGFGFDPTAENNTVTFNDGAVGTVTAATATRLTVKFSMAPTTAGKLCAVVTSNGLSSSSMMVATVIPVITSSSTNVAASAETLTISGFGFDPTAANNSVTFNDGAVGSVTAATPTSLTVMFSTTPTAAGTLSAWLTSNGKSNDGSVIVASVVPVVVGNMTVQAANETTLTINGYGFDATAANNSVTFSDGAVGAVTASTSSTLTIALSTRPETAGSLTAIVSANGQTSGAAVQVAAIAPVVTASSMSLAASPSSVTISGFGFDPIAANNSVAFNNGAVGDVTSATSISLTVTFSTSPSSAAGLTAVVTTGGLTSGSAVQVAMLKPTVASPSSASVTSTSAVLGGNVTGDGGATISERGVLLALSAGEPLLTLGSPNVTKLTASGTLGAFTVNASDLAGGMTYSYVAYAVNDAGVTYTSTNATFSTPPGLQVSSFSPTIVALPASNLTINSATLTGNVVTSGGAAITARGIVLSLTSTNANPLVGGAGVINLTTTGTTGVYTVNANSLNVGGSYSFAAYATNGNGTSYSSVGTFATLPAVGQLSGVTLQVIGHQLILTGDNTADHIQVTGDGTAREYIVSGLAGTLINGVANAAITVQGIDNMLLNLTAGADIITIDGADLAGGITIGGGSGNKNISIGATSDVSVGGSISVSGGAGDDVILVNRTHVAGSLVIQGGSGGVSNQITTKASTITGDLTIYGAAGYDLVQQTQLTVGGAWTISTGAGNDLISVSNSRANGPVIFSSGTGTDFIAADTLNLAGNLALDGSAGGEFKNIVLSNSIIGAAVYETGGAMGNSLSFNNNVAQALVVNGGAGNDAVFVRTSILDQLFANLGDGADSMDIRFTRVKKVASLDAGLQTDSLTMQGNWFDSLTTANFENFANY